MERLFPKNNGFTIIELIVTVAILGLVMGFGVNSYSKNLQNSYDNRRELDVGKIRVALEKYRSNNPDYSYPVTLPSLIPNYFTELPVDPETNQTYSSYYTVSACLTPPPSPNLCTSYRMVVPLEQNHSIIATPLEMNRATPTP